MNKKQIITEFRKRFLRFYISKTPKETIVNTKPTQECFILDSVDIEEWISYKLSENKTDLQSVISMLSGNVEPEKITNFIKEYLLK